MTTTQLTEGGTQTKTIQELACSRSIASAIQPYAYYFSTIHILLSLTAILGNSLILVPLYKESSLYPPSKVFYRCLATTDLLVGFVVHPLAVIWFNVFYPRRLGSLSMDIPRNFHIMLCVMFGISVYNDGHKRGRLLAMLLRLRYRQILTVKRIHVILITFWIASGVNVLCESLNYRISFWYSYIFIASCLMITFASYSKIF